MIKDIQEVADREGKKKIYFIISNKAGTGFDDCWIKYVGETSQISEVMCTCKYGTIQSSLGEKYILCRHTREMLAYLEDKKDELKTETTTNETIDGQDIVHG